MRPRLPVFLSVIFLSGCLYELDRRPSDGATKDGGGNGTCGPSSCSGCCTSGVCLAGLVLEACGAKGAPCVSCVGIGKEPACNSGTCANCTPSCGGKQCGSNGCGGSCGDCAIGETCDGLGKCVSTAPTCLKGTCATSPTVLQVVNSAIFSAISAKLDTFAADLAAAGFAVGRMLVAPGSQPTAIRQLLIDYRAKNKLVGAYLIGDIKAAYAEGHLGDFSNPRAISVSIIVQASDHYYMDLDGEWQTISNPTFCASKPANVVKCFETSSTALVSSSQMVGFKGATAWDYGAAADHPSYQIDIWVSRIAGHDLNLPGKNETTIISDFLDWDHQYRTAAPSVADKAYLLSADSGLNDQGMDFTGVFSQIEKHTSVTASQFDEYLQDSKGSKFLYLSDFTASSATNLGFSGGGNLPVDQLLTRDRTPLFYIFNASEACAWDRYRLQPTAPNYLCGIFVFDKTSPHINRGLAAVGLASPGGLNWLQYFSVPLQTQPGATYADAFVYWFNKSLMAVFAPMNISILGDPAFGPKK